MTHTHEYRRETGVTFLFFLMMFALFMGAAWLLWSSPLNRSAAEELFYGVVSVIVSLFGMTAALRYKVTLRDDDIELRSIRKRRLKFGQINKVRLYRGSLTLKGKSGSLRIGSEVQNREELYMEIASRLSLQGPRDIDGAEAFFDEYLATRS